MRRCPVPSRPPDPADHLPLKPDVLFILLALAAEPLHGYGIIRDVDARSDGQVVLQTGALYRTLRRLLQDRFIEECAKPAGADSDDERRRYYTLTGLGRAVATAEVARLSRVVRAARLSPAKRPRLT
jgi:DNA-binding PadR family transcriptional regulator